MHTTCGYSNVYVPNHASARKDFWCKITNTLPNLPHLCVVRDFKMIEDLINSKGGSMVTIHGEELAILERICLKLSNFDA